MTDLLTWLQSYYLSLCDGDWEHSYGFAIDNIDNPGWSLKFDLGDTRMASVPFERRQIDRSETDWVNCWVEADAFHAACGPQNLSEALTVFRDWVTNSLSHPAV